LIHHSPNSGVSHHLTPYSILCDSPLFEEEDNPPDLHRYHPGGFSYRRQPLDILRSFLLYYL
jgi:hypothetical protein